jgi:mediator of RNA polymerase II transcription subunit 5
LFLTEKLASFEPVDKAKASKDAEVADLVDSTVGLEAVVIPDLVIVNSRAGLYIYLNACVRRSIFGSCSLLTATACWTASHR